MNTPIPECPACRERMQEGFMIDHRDHQGIGRARWTEGPIEKGLLGNLKTKGRRQLDTVTFRCPRCGWLIWFAPAASASGSS